MAKENFPRLRTRNFGYVDTFTVMPYQAGRLDYITQERYGEPRAYRVLAAANGIVDAFTTRPGIRPATEALENELVLRGVKPSQAKKTAERIDEMRVLGSRDWLSYGNLTDGNITDVYPDRVMFVPSPDTAAAWIQRYDTLKDEDVEG
jgi:hypothetical protein